MARKIDLVTLEMIQEYLIATVREMRVTMIMTAHSSIIYEGHDFSCALLDGEGQLVAQSEDSPAHVIPLPWQVREAREHFGADLSPGDVILVNDPYSSGTHMNDVAMIMPYFVGRKPIAFIVTRAHWGDIGGMTPGSISGQATEIFQEGLRIPFIKVYEKGKPVKSLLNLIFSNVRIPDEREGDFHAMLACCNTAKGRLDELVEKFGRAQLASVMRALLDRAEKRMRRAIATIPEGVYRYEDYLDSDNAGRPVLLKVKVTAKEERLHVDYAGSSLQVQGPVNGSLAVTAMGTFVALKALLDPHGPINHGAFRRIQVEAPKGTIVNVQPPGAVGGYTEIRRRVESVMMGALASAVPKYVAGDIKGTSNHTYIGSRHPRRGRDTIFYEYPAGGTGGFLEHDGSDAMRAYDEGDFSSIQPVEAVEIEHALLIETCALNPDTSGAGMKRGGLGLKREIRLLAEEGRFSELSDRNLIPPYGVCGGHAGAPNRFTVRRGNEIIAPSNVPGKVSGFPLRQGDVVVVETAGGGGYGTATERDPAQVALDVRECYITAGHARARYGVVIVKGAVDEAATKTLRRQMTGQVRRLQVTAADLDRFEDGRRVTVFSPADVQALGGDGALVEFVNPFGAPLRSWIAASPEVAAGAVALGPEARVSLGLKPGDPAEVRSLKARAPS